jgi:hypothetical protein
MAATDDNEIFLSQEDGPPPLTAPPSPPNGPNKTSRPASTRPATELHGGKVQTPSQLKASAVLVVANKANGAKCVRIGLAPALVDAVHNSKKCNWARYAKEATKGARGPLPLALHFTLFFSLKSCFR